MEDVESCWVLMTMYQTLLRQVVLICTYDSEHVRVRDHRECAASSIGGGDNLSLLEEVHEQDQSLECRKMSSIGVERARSLLGMQRDGEKRRRKREVEVDL